MKYDRTEETIEVNLRQQWIDLIYTIPGADVEMDFTWAMYQEDPELIIFGGVFNDWESQFYPDNWSESLFFFRTENRAEFNEVEGTWVEVFEMIRQHSFDNFIPSTNIPVPQTMEDATIIKPVANWFTSQNQQLSDN